MDAKQLAEIKVRAEKATLGEWKVSETPQSTNVICGNDRRFLIIARWLDSIDAQFIAHARTDIPALIAEVERLNVLAEQRYQLYDGALTTIATLEKALELKCEDQSDVDRMISYAKQAQEVPS